MIATVSDSHYGETDYLLDTCHLRIVRELKSERIPSLLEFTAIKEKNDNSKLCGIGGICGFSMHYK